MLASPARLRGRKRRRPARTTRADARQRRGAVLVFFAVLLVALMAMLAFAVDVGFMAATKTDLKATVDAAALAGVGALVDGNGQAIQEARTYATEKNSVGSAKLNIADVTVDLGQWDLTSRSFAAGGTSPNAVRVSGTRKQAPFFFAKVLGKQNFDLTESAVATYQPREIMLALDFSGSMCFDSQFLSISKLGRTAVEENQYQIYQELGSPKFGKMQWTPQYISSGNTNTVKQTLGLTNVAYPYPGGSWSDYISYVMNDSDVNSAGYRKKYGYLTWINYLLDVQRDPNETPVLWKTSEQPLKALKNATTLFLGYIKEGKTDDRCGLVVYSTNATEENELTLDFMPLADKLTQRQAAGSTNIGDGIRLAREEIAQRGRLGAFKLIVLMTDGEANAPYSSTTACKDYVIQQANLAQQEGIVILTIGMGADSDQSLMQQVASITGGVYFYVPGGSDPGDYEAQLRDVFQQVARARPLQLVQ